VLAAIREFFDRRIAPCAGENSTDAGHRLKVAAAVLLVEVARSDHEFTAAERESVLASVQRNFGLATAEAQEVLALAEAESNEAHDIYQFVSAINAGFPPERKARLVEELWRAAFADSNLRGHEEHLIRRVADMLHLPHSQFIAAKLRAMAGNQE
jgi:uncharacterized tellurite resistance protein B-like protein